jgi:predicted RNA-binding protein Jag
MISKHSFSGKNSDEALEKAAQFFKVDKSFVSYNLIDQSAKSFFSKIFSRGIQIEAWVETDTNDLKAAAREAVRQAFQKQDPEKLEVSSLFKEYQSFFFAPFQIKPSQISNETSEQDVVVHIKDEFMEKLLSKSDKLSLSFEHVFKRIAQKKVGDVSGRITLNAGTSIENREERLIGMAKSLAEKVKKTGKNIILSSKSGQERRIIHLAIEGVEGVATKSSGTGEKRRLIIYSTATNAKPKRKKPIHARQN